MKTTSKPQPPAGPIETQYRAKECLHCGTLEAPDHEKSCCPKCGAPRDDARRLPAPPEPHEMIR